MDKENINKRSYLDIIKRIEKLLPLEYDLLIRTNHDSDGTSGAPRSEGNWFVHLIKCKGHRDHGNVEHISIYYRYGNNLYKMLCEVEDKVEKEINSNKNSGITN